MNTESKLDIALERFTGATQAYLEASKVTSLLTSRSSLYDPSIQLSLERLGSPIDTTLSMEANIDRSAGVLKRLKEALIKAYYYLVSIFKEVVYGYQSKINRLHDKLIDLEDIVKNMSSEGKLNLQVRLFIDNLVLGNNLFITERVSYDRTVDALNYFQNWVSGTNQVWGNRVNINKALATNTSALESRSDLLRAIKEPPLTDFKLTRLNNAVDIDPQLNTVFVSNPLPGNVVLRYLEQRQPGHYVPYVESPSGFSYNTTSAIDLTDRRLLRVPVLAGGEITSLIQLVRRNLGDLKRLVSSANSADYHLSITAKAVAGKEPLFENASARDLYYAYLERSMRNEAKFVIDSMDRQFKFLFYCSQWINYSLTYYK